MKKKQWTSPEVINLGIQRTEGGNGPITTPDEVKQDGNYTWYSFPSE